MYYIANVFSGIVLHYNYDCRISQNLLQISFFFSFFVVILLQYVQKKIRKFLFYSIIFLQRNR